MLRPALLRTRPLRVFLAASIILGLLQVAAVAQEAGPHPVIDQAPGKVRFGALVVIRGHLENGTAGEEIELQRRRPGGNWWTIATKQVDGDARVEFRRQDLKRSTTYRLRYTDVATRAQAVSDIHRVQVVPKLTLRVNPDDIFRGRYVTLRGRLLPKVSPRRTIVLRQRVGGEWRWIKRVGVDQDGRFVAKFQANDIGFRKIRATFAGDALNTFKKKVKPLTIYGKDRATWYGPGFYGRSTACGQKMSKTILGVAHRTLPCGTKVSILYNGNTITVPVIDRGPYSHANWDLTEGAARRLGFSGTDTIGATR